MSDELKLGDPVSFYNGTETLRFAKEGWKWYRVMPDGELYMLDGVTGIVHIIDKSQHLMPWACKMMSAKIERTVPRTSDAEGDNLVTRLLPTPWREFMGLVDAAKSAHKETLEDAGEVGSAAHSWLEASIRNAITFNKGVIAEMTAMAPIDERAVNCGMAAFRFLTLHNARFMSTERPIFSREFLYAGTTDGEALLDDCGDSACCSTMYDSKRFVIDFKTSNYLYTTHVYQVGAYAQALTEEFGTKFDGAVILRLGKTEGDFESHFVRDLPAAFEGYRACQVLTQIHHEAEKAMSAEKRARTARKRAAAKEQKLAEKEAVKSAKAAEKAAKKAAKA